MERRGEEEKGGEGRGGRRERRKEKERIKRGSGRDKYKRDMER